MKPYYQHNGITIYNADCIKAMSEMPDNSVDSIVTDPPYGLSFMGKKWDYEVPSVWVWREALRVLKPGGYLLSFAGTRTQHRMCCNIEDAGFEIRDMIAWIYGSGFPKSHNIGKAVDKLQGNEREVIGEKKLWGHNAGSGAGSFSKNAFEGQTGITRSEPLTKGASQYEGWGTALKPALEPITLARKPLSEKTVAKNVLKWGTGGINIDGCRVETNPNIDDPRLGGKGKWTTTKGQDIYGGGKGIPRGTVTSSDQGRFPANLIHDGSQQVLDLFPDSNGSGSKRTLNRSAKPQQEGWGMNKSKGDDVVLPDAGKGSAARFFYCAKASKKDRNNGCEELDSKTAAELTGRAEGSKGLSGSSEYGNSTNPFANGGSVQPRKNHHPTVKPTDLMAYLCRLVTPTGGIVLDPYMGSGSTGKACVREGFGFIGIEKDTEEGYCEIAAKRLSQEYLAL